MSKNILSKANNLPGLLVGLIIRPPRAKYDIEHLGPTKFTVDDRVCERYDLELKNERGLVLKCSHFMQVPAMPSPCVIYLHGNCGCRLDAFESVAVALRDGISLFCFDFAGSGLSEGEYISLGFYERDDVRTVVEYLRGVDHVTTIGLWGRSMGAATAIMYGATDPSIAGMVLDSPFTSLPKLAGELVTSKELPIQIPKVAFNVGLKAIRKSIKHKVKFDIEELVPIKYVDQCFAPALFIHGESDTFILPHHGEELYEAYAGDKNYILVEGDHNSLRPAFCNDSVSIFFRNTLLAGHDLYPSPREICSKPEVLAIPSLEELELYKDLPRIAIERPQDLCEDDELQQALLLSLSDPGQVDSSALFEFADAIEEKMGESIHEGAVIEKKYTEEPEKDKKSNRKVEKKANKKSEKPEKKEKKSKKRKFRKLTFSKKKPQKRISVPEPLYQEEVQEDLEKVGKKEKKKKEKTKKHLKTEIPELINETPPTYSKQSEERSTDLPEVCAPKSSKRKRKKKRRSSLTAPKVQRSFSDVN